MMVVQPGMVQPEIPTAVVAGTPVAPGQPMEMVRESKAGAQEEDSISKLKGLKELLDVGAITQAEFAEKKAKLMAKI